MEKLWPYVLPLPTKPDRHYKLLQTVFGSKAALEILKKAPSRGRIYQRDLIAELSFSNKTVIEALKRLVSIGVLEEGMEKVEARGRGFWSKWYAPTPLGRWLILLLKPPSEVSREDIEGILKELFGIYVDSAMKLCDDYGIDSRILEDALKEAHSHKGQDD